MSNSDSPSPPRSIWAFLIPLAGVAGVAELAYAIVGVSELSVYLEKGLKLGGIVGASFGAFYLSEAVLNSPMGTLADRLGRRRMMVIGPLVSFFTCLSLALLRVPPGPYGVLIAGLIVLFLRILDGAGAAALWPAVFASVGDRVGEARRATAMSVLTITYFAGVALGPLIGGVANEVLGKQFGVHDPRRYVPSLYTAAILFLLTAIAAYFVAPSRHSQAHHAEGEDASSHADDGHGAFSLAAAKQAWQRFPSLMLLAFITFLAVGLIIPYVKIFVQQKFGVTETGFAKLLLYPALIIGVLAVPVGRLSDGWGKALSIRGGMGVCAASLWLMLTLKGEIAVIVAGALLGLGFLLAFPAYMAFLSDLTGPKERGGTLGAVRAAQGIGALVGTIFSSPLYKLVAHEAPFYAAASLLTLGFILSFIFIRTPAQAFTGALVDSEEPK